MTALKELKAQGLPVEHALRMINAHWFGNGVTIDWLLGVCEIRVGSGLVGQGRNLREATDDALEKLSASELQDAHEQIDFASRWPNNDPLKIK